MQDRGITPNTVVYGILINGMCEAGKIEDARKLFSSISAKGLKPNVKTYTALIGGLCKEALLDEAEELLLQMEGDGCPPNDVTYNIVVRAFLKRGDKHKIVGHSVLCYVKLKYSFVKPRKLIKLLKVELLRSSALAYEAKPESGTSVISWQDRIRELEKHGVKKGSGKRVVLVATDHAKEEKKMGIQRGGMATLVELNKMETSPIGSQGDGLNACGLGGPWMAVELYWLGGVSGWSTGYYGRYGWLGAVGCDGGGSLANSYPGGLRAMMTVDYGYLWMWSRGFEGYSKDAAIQESNCHIGVLFMLDLGSIGNLFIAFGG
ncbi:hypothetical protein C3L33_15039, partial [Rhododendron williamsianum]